jgi:hypothetical protein
MCGICSTHEETRNEYKILMGKPQGKIPPGWRSLGWGDIIKIGCEGVDWIALNMDRVHWRAVVNTIMIFQFAKSR